MFDLFGMIREKGEKMISKELLKEVLEINDIAHIQKEGKNDLFISRFKNPALIINIYELADKVIDWIESQGYWIKIEDKHIYQLVFKGKEVYGIDTKKRLDVAFMCGQWILNNKED